MTMALYSPEDVIILVAGAYQLEGLQDGSFVSISDSKERWITTTSADGSVSRTHVKPSTHDVKVTLTSTSSSNSILSSWATADGILYGAVLPMIIKDTLGSTMFFTTECWIEKVPETTFSTEITGREWVFKSSGGQLAVGGNEGGIGESFASLGAIASTFSGLL